MITWKDFEQVDMRVGTVVRVENFPEARKPAYKLEINFGPEIGTKKSSAQITDLYKISDILGKQVIAVVNFPPKQIGPYISECLVMGIYNQNNQVILLQPERAAPNGAKIG
ncbi:tRNA-binding protein [Marinoscillum sp. 108]|uniref:tRNA-binding protein n=1 Tax=Marinoscillum sp. 108 TaxID=2653151 RepID=UPI0012F463DE|nr:tRNA-binding protein [Marinoscillum sp. 108]VXD19324.1 putative chaperone CsaA [Marinoscillum sp. 108]